jgi:aryl-alcohol dehydrogenase-like predicted oxidoreductase
MQLDYRPLGKSHLEVSHIGLGCVTFGREIDEATAFAVMDHAVDCGITLFDTAEIYAQGRSEEVVGNWLKSRGKRQRLILATKVAKGLTRERVTSSCEASLRRLQTDYIDLFQVHHFDNENPLEETLAGLDELVKQGKVRAIGCSNYAAWQVCKALWQQDVHAWARFESTQECYNLTIRNIEKEVIPLARDQQLGILAYSPLGAGFLTGKYGRDRVIPTGTRFAVVPGHSDPYFLEESFAIVDRLRATSAASGISMIHLALAWVLRQPAITSMLVGARKPEHIDQALEALALDVPAGLWDEK